jgi:hypothetical protein
MFLTFHFGSPFSYAIWPRKDVCWSQSIGIFDTNYWLQRFFSYCSWLLYYVLTYKIFLKIYHPEKSRVTLPQILSSLKSEFKNLLTWVVLKEPLEMHWLIKHEITSERKSMALLQNLVEMWSHPDTESDFNELIITEISTGVVISITKQGRESILE